VNKDRKDAITYRAAFYIVTPGKLSRDERSQVAAVLRDLRNGKLSLTALIQ
jgi:hypothetical protein